MAATSIPVTSATRLTVVGMPVAGNTVDGMTMANDGRTDLWYRKTNAGTGSFVVVPTKTIGAEALAVANLTVAVAASQDWTPLGYFDPDVYGTTLTIITVSATTIQFKAWNHG